MYERQEGKFGTDDICINTIVYINTVVYISIKKIKTVSGHKIKTVSGHTLQRLKLIPVSVG